MTEAELINQIIARSLEGVHTTLVGKVEAVGLVSIDVQPVTKKVLNGCVVDMPLFKDVPPIFIQGGTSYEAYPIAVGDYCLLFVSESSIERWYMGQDDMAPNEDRKFDYSDSFAIVGINPFSSAKPIPLITTAIGDKIITGDYTQTGIRTHIGAEEITGTTMHTGDIILNGVSLQQFIEDHTHEAGTPPGNTSVPNAL